MLASSVALPQHALMLPSTDANMEAVSCLMLFVCTGNGLPESTQSQCVVRCDVFVGVHLLGWRPSLLDWRPLLLGSFCLLLLGWRPLFLGARTLLTRGSWPYY